MSLASDIEKLAAPMVAQAGLELVDVEYQREPGGWTIRFYIDKPGGFGLTDCEEWSDRLGQLIEDHQLITHGYSLEVSSPGLNRPLKKPDDFQRFMGTDVVIKLFAAQNGQKNFHGRMTALAGGELEIFDRSSGLVRIPLASIASAKLDPVIEINTKTKPENLTE